MSKAEEIKERLGLIEHPLPAGPRTPPEIPDHTLVRRIGDGSYGEVWLARNVVGSYRAVKIVYRDSFRDERPYQREFDGIQRFEPISRSSEGFVHILQIGRNDAAGCFYYVMELADDVATEPATAENRESGNAKRPGQSDKGSTTTRSARFQSRLSNPDTYIPRTLAETRSRSVRLPASECVELGLSLTRALAHLHAHGLLHRDIKPSNIIFVHGAPKLADIGLVAETAEAESFVGTEGFIPPEGPNSAQADIYSLGKVLYEIAMGRDRHDFPDPFSGLWETAEAETLLELNAVILKACATDRRERYGSAEEMEADLALIQSGRSVRRRRALRSRLRRLAMVTGAIALLALAALGMNSWLEYRVEQLQARPTVGAGRLAGRIPARDASATLNQIDLAAHYNVLLDEHWFGPPGNDLASLPRGLQTFADITFDLRGVIQLASSGVPMVPGIEFSRGAHGLNVGFRCEQLHFLHGTISGAGEAQEIGRYVVHYSDGARRMVPIRYGMEVRDYWGWTGPGQETANAVVAWRGENAATRERGFTLRLYRTTWRNPLPHVPIASLDFVASGSSSAPFLLAVTADPHAASQPVFEPDLIDEIQAHAAHYQEVRVSRAFGQPAFQTVRLNTEGRRAGAAYYDAIRVTTPPEPGWDLVWVTTFVGLASCDAWQIAPVEGGMRVGFEDWYHGSRAHYRDLPRQEGRQDLALQYLDGRKLRQNTDYLIWFAFNDDQPVDLRLAITFVPPGQVSPGRPDLLEAALGLERIDHVQDTDDMTIRTNCGPGLHRHFCLGASHW
jgi:hypothetical protein